MSGIEVTAAGGASSSGRTVDFSTLTTGDVVTSGTLVLNGAFLYRRITTGTVEAVFDPTLWTAVFSGSTTTGVGAPATLQEGALYFAQDGGGNVISVYRGTSTPASPVKVLDSTPPVLYGTNAARLAVSIGTLLDGTEWINTDASGGRYQVRSGVWALVTLPGGVGIVAADTTVANASTVLVDLAGMGVPIGTSATEVWRATYTLMWNASTASDVKIGWGTMPTSATVSWGPTSISSNFGGFGVVAAATSPLPILIQSGTFTAGMGGNTSGMFVTAFIFGGGTAGTVAIQAAQGTSDPTNLVLKKGSLVEYRQVKT